MTDADLLQGKMVIKNFPFFLNTDLGTEAINKIISENLGIPDIESALGITEVVDENMASAAKTHAAEYGLDLGERDLIALGGAAPLHAANLGSKVKAKRILIPKNAAVGSALGFLLAAASYEVVRSRHMNLLELNFEVINKIYEEMRDEALAIVTLAHQKQFFKSQTDKHEIFCGPRAKHQKIPNESFLKSRFKCLRPFEAEYEQVYGHILQKQKIESSHGC